MICFNSIVNSTQQAGIWLWITVSPKMIVSLAARWVFKNISLVLPQELAAKDHSSSVQVAKDLEAQSRQLVAQLEWLASQVHTRKAAWCMQHRCKLSVIPRTVCCSITAKEWPMFLTISCNQHHHILARNSVLGPVSQVELSLPVAKRFSNKAHLTTKVGSKILVLLKC